MPHIDGRSGDIVVRIVYDGAPEAGKTSNVQGLYGLIPLQRRGTLAAPGTTQRRTEFFDWLDFAGGFVDGRRLRCQLVSVPGQPQLLHRRKYLLETADTIVYVADSNPEQVAGNRDCLAVLRRILDSLTAALPVGIVLQANKQDLPGALAPAALLSALQLPASVPVVPSVAIAGRGVLDTFVLAARLATDRVRGLLRDGSELEELVERDASAGALHSAMLAAEKHTSVVPAAIEPPPPPPSPESAATPLLRRRINDTAHAANVSFPRPESLLAGHIWPPVRGRASLLAALSDRRPTIPERALDWAPPAPIELAFDEGWVLHSSSQWLFDGDATARIGLRMAVRQLLAAPGLLPEGRAIFLGPDAAGYRLWMLTPAVPSIADELLDALGALDRKRVVSALVSAKHATALLEEVRGTGAVPGGAAGVTMHDGRVALLAGVDPDEAALAATTPEVDALALAERACAGDQERLACLAAALRSRELAAAGGSHGS